MYEKISYKKIIKSIIVLTLSSFLSYKCQPYVHNNKDAIQLIIDLFSTLIGFLIAIMSFSYLSIKDNDTWKDLEYKRRVLEKRNTQYTFLFIIYLFVLILIFISFLLETAHSSKHNDCTKYAEYIYLFLSFIALCLSFSLPITLYKTQVEPLEDEIRKRSPKGLFSDFK